MFFRKIGYNKRMKRKLSLLLIIVLCLSSLLMFSSCDFILDLVFGPSDSPDSHVHTLDQQTYSGQMCTGQSEIKYYKCSVCGKCYLDSAGRDEIDETTLGKGHLYTLRYSETEHFRQCSLCNAEQEGSREAHICEHYKYNANSHYRQCSICLVVYDEEAHDAKLSCDICGRRADYVSICAGRYGYEQLKTFNKGESNNDGKDDVGTRMQKLYIKIAEKVASVHEDAGYNCTREIIDTASSSTAYVLTVESLDYRLSGDETRIVVACFRYDNPLYYWLDSRVSLSAQENSQYVRAVNFCVNDNYYLGSQRVAKNAEIYVAIDNYLSGVSQITDAYYLTLALHDDIIRNIDYAYKDDGSAQDEYWAHNILGVFSNKSAVCEGYAKAFQLLLNASGVENAYAVGKGYVAAENRYEGHAWNLVKLDNNQWYWYDLTWDDQPESSRGVIYNYFCKSDNEFLEDHTVSTVKTGIDYMYDLPEVATEDYNGNSLKLNATFTQDGFTYKLLGADRLAIIGCSKNGNVVVPSFVTYDDQDYAVRELSDTALVMSSQGGMKLICGAITLTIPSTVDLIYNNSIYECKTLANVKFVDTVGWSRMSNQFTELVDETSLSDATMACNLLKQAYNFNGKQYSYVWQKSATAING